MNYCILTLSFLFQCCICKNLFLSDYEIIGALEMCGFCTRCIEHKPNYTWYMSILNHIWRTQANYTRYMSILYQIWRTQANYTRYMSILYQIWRTQAKLYLINVNFAPDMENTSQIILDICQYCNRYGEHKPNYTW